MINYLNKILRLKIISTKKSDDSSYSFHENIEENNITQETAIDLAETDEEITTLEQYISPKTIHAYFQWKNSQLMKHMSMGNGNTQCWKINEDTILTKDNLFQVSESLYACISPEINLDTATKKSFQNALEKGVVNRSKGVNGIKFIENKIIELKINADIRLYTDRIYVNEDGQRLIIFENKANHNEISRVAGKCKQINIIKTIPVNIPQISFEQLPEEKIVEMFASDHGFEGIKTEQLKELLLAGEVLSGEDSKCDDV